MTLVTCHTPGCPNADQTIDLDLTFTDENGESQRVDSVICGVCDQPITDIAGE